MSERPSSGRWKVAIHGKPSVSKIQIMSTSGSRNGCVLVPDKGLRRLQPPTHPAPPPQKKITHGSSNLACKLIQVDYSLQGQFLIMIFNVIRVLYFFFNACLPLFLYSEKKKRQLRMSLKCGFARK